VWPGQKPSFVPSDLLIHPAVSTIDMGRTFGGGWAVPLGVELSPHLTQCSPGGPRPTFVPSGILIHPAVWPQWAEK